MESRVNAQMLMGKIKERGTNVEEVAKALGVDKTTLYRHIKSGNFSLPEVFQLKEILSLSEQEAIRIFFGFDVV